MTHAHHARTLLVGVDDDTLKWTPFPLTVVRRQEALGAHAVRVWVPWHGEIAPTAVRRDELARAEIAARRTTVVLAVFGFGAQTPTAAWQRTRFCGYAKAALSLVPNARAVVVWNEANSPTYWRGTAAQYELLLARCYGELHSKHVEVLDSTASAHNPIAFIGALATAYRDSGRKQPLVDAFGHNPYPETPTESPSVVHRGDFLGEADYARLVTALRAFGGTPSIWYLEDGFQTTKITPAQQASDITVAIGMAACQPLVQAYFNFELVDERRLAGWHSGLIWRGGRLKPAAAAFKSAPRRCRT
ncbi:MAG: hypothetical protein JOY73_01385 [Actinobacteria bacterium]|nr:hypothetical protein [Actinomycetota bacterium]